MALMQFELDDEHTDALEHVAKSNKTSRRQYLTEFVSEALDRVPGLMKMIRDRRLNGIKLENQMEVAEVKHELIKEMLPEEIYTFRFNYLDPSRGFIEGRGPTPGKAFMDAAKRDTYIDADEYAREFRPPQRM